MSARKLNVNLKGAHLLSPDTAELYVAHTHFFSGEQMGQISNSIALQQLVRSSPRDALQRAIRTSNKAAIVEAEKLIRAAFPSGEGCDIFLSHAHCDKKHVHRLKCALVANAISVFVDSDVWANYRDIQDILLDSYAMKAENDDWRLYDTDILLHISGHLQQILAECLHDQIAKSRRFVLLQSGGAHHFGLNGQPATFSRWIMTEVACVNRLWTPPIVEHRDKAASVLFEHELRISQWPKLTLSQLKRPGYFK